MNFWKFTLIILVILGLVLPNILSKATKKTITIKKPATSTKGKKAKVVEEDDDED